MAFLSSSPRALILILTGLMLLSSFPLPVFAAPQRQQSNAMVSTPLGTAIVVNQCTFDVQSNVVHGPRPGAEGPPEEVYRVVPAGGEAEHPYLHDPGMGISWKLWPAHAPQPVQFEWTWEPAQSLTYWDLSMIDAGVKKNLTARYEPEQLGEGSENGGEDPAPAPAPAPGNTIAHSFAAYGMIIEPVRDGEAFIAENCFVVACPAGQAGCVAAYNFPEDWKKQRACPESANLRLTLCP